MKMPKDVAACPRIPRHHCRQNAFEACSDAEGFPAVPCVKVNSNKDSKVVLRVKLKIFSKVPLEDFVVHDKEEKYYETQVVRYTMKLPPVPIPKFPLEMTWNPKIMYFVLDEEPVTLRVRIWNSSDRSMYFHYCGLWGDRARIGASWYCFPRTRIWLPSGLWGEIIVKATPRVIAPIACAIASIQVAAGHLRDNVTGYFSIPIQAKFLKYIPPPSAEGE